MRILVSNDDGYLAPGIKCLAQVLATHGDVVVIAPDRDQSGASSSLTLKNPLRVSRSDDGTYVVTGTPTDCIHLGITGLLDVAPDVVVSGINAGANLGDDVIYSGTVAAAMEGRSLGLPSIAVSLVLEERQPEERHHYETAARATSELLARLRPDTMPIHTVLNVNVPDIAWADVRGFKATRLGNRHRAEPMLRELDPRGREIFWVGPPGAEQDAGEGTDFDAVRHGYVSVTPMHVDLTRHSAIDSTAAWINGSATD